MKVICIGGKARHGKDTAAKYMKKKLESMGNSVLITHYADLLKYICKTFFGWNGLKDDAGRTLLQHVGTDVIREKYPEYWVGFIADLLWFFPDEWDYVLIPDCRFPNEIEEMKKNNEVVSVKLIRDGFKSPLSEEQQNHPSETALDGYEFDYVIHNRDMGDFYRCLSKLVADIVSDERGRVK